MNQALQMNVNHEERHEEKWENLLKEVTVNKDSREISVNPTILQAIQSDESRIQWADMMGDSMPSEETQRQIETLRSIAERKLKGVNRYAFLLMLLTETGVSRIAELLGVSTDSVQRAIQRAVRCVRKCLHSKQTGEFPIPAGKRPPMRAALFPLDTPEEKVEFQNFLNLHTIVHISYRGDSLFREVLVVYLTGKKGQSTPSERTVMTEN